MKKIRSIVGDTMKIVEVKNLYKKIKNEKKEIELLRNITFDVENGEFVSIMGQSGSGKSTLLGLIAGIDDATEGSVWIENVNITRLKDEELVKYRNQKIGLILQSPNLIETLTAKDNVEVPRIFGKSAKASTKKAEEILDMVGLKDKSKLYPKQLSGGEQQRVAIARALACNPRVILADEPTGALDSSNGENVINILKSLVKDSGVTVIMVTHDNNMAKKTDRIVYLKDGELYYQD